MTSTDEKKRPAYTLKAVAVVETDRTKREVYTELAAVWENKGGVLSLDIPPGITVSGRLILVPTKKGDQASTPAGVEPNDHFRNEGGEGA